MEQFDVVIIGGGSGLTAAYFAQQDEKKIALVDRLPDALGGTCVNRGCIPTKGLIQAAEVMKTIRSAQKFGIRLPQDQVEVDFPALVDRVLERRKSDASGVKGWVDSAFTPFYGEARFIDEKTLEVEDGRQLKGEKVFIASGARPAIPPVPGLEEVPYWTNEDAIENRELPQSLIILGGGYIGCEFGHFFATLGTDVTVVERNHALMPEDEDVRGLFGQEFSKKVQLLAGHSAEAVSREDGKFVVQAKGPQGTKRLEADRLLVATGRRPNTDALDLHKTKVETRDGWVVVDDRLRTTHPDIYAYGDVIGQGMFKHTSSKEGEIAYRNSQGADLVMDYTTNPHAVFSDPQIGSVGLTEEQAREKGLRFKVSKMDYKDVAKGRILGSPPGLAKLLVEEGSDRILGFHMVGPNAADLVHEVVLAMEHGLTAQAVRDTIHIHPTLPELIKSVFDAA